MSFLTKVTDLVKRILSPISIIHEFKMDDGKTRVMFGIRVAKIFDVSVGVTLTDDLAEVFYNFNGTDHRLFLVNSDMLTSVKYVIKLIKAHWTNDEESKKALEDISLSQTEYNYLRFQKERKLAEAKKEQEKLNKVSIKLKKAKKLRDKNDPFEKIIKRIAKAKKRLNKVLLARRKAEKKGKKWKERHVHIQAQKSVPVGNDVVIIGCEVTA